MKLFLLTSITSIVFCFYKQGHSLIGNLVDLSLSNSTRVNIGMSIKDISPWADSIRRKKGYSWVSPLHYINTGDDAEHNICNPSIDKDDKNIYTALQNYTERISNKETRTDEDLKFFVHFYQDLFQPLHMSGIYRGGNRYKVLFFGRKASLHQVWDYLILRNRIKELKKENYTNHMLNIIGTLGAHKPYDFAFWIKHNNKLNCDYVYNNDIQQGMEITEQYYQDAKIVLEVLIAMSAINLKTILEDLY